MLEDQLRQEFWLTKAKIDKIEESSASMREQRDIMFQHIEASRANVKTLTAQINEVEQGLFELKTHLAMLARALKGQTGEAPVTPPVVDPKKPWWKLF